MTLINELNSIYDYLHDMYPTATIVRQDVPASPVADTFVIVSQYTDIKTETGASFLNDREFQLVYYGASSAAVFTRFDDLETKAKNGQFVIPLRGSSRYIRVKGFSYGSVFATQTGTLKYAIAVMQTETRDMRELPEYEKIMTVNSAVKNEE
ncbi:hypothetical protein [Heyndrickxia coagulans]|uniref:hypothetical protein n=1 Tax=Heyndrickxia coagulans TaxID=1398 RepID=UPI000779F057|nr:hypothetical protein [Heyndrickxia coagulans]